MKSSLRVVLFTMLVMLVFSVGAGAAEKPVWQNLRWGDSADKLQVRTIHMFEDGLDMYLDLETEKLGNVPVTALIYLFWQDQFLAVFVETTDPGSARHLLELKYGKPNVEDWKPIFGWVDATWLIDDGETEVYIEEDLSSETGFFTITWVPMYLAYLEELQESMVSAW